MDSRLAHTPAPSPVDDGMFRKRPEYAISQGVAVVHVLGTTAKGLSQLERDCGNTGYEELHADLDRAERDRAEAILFVIDSLGGHLMGLPELAQRIRSMEIPTVAFTPGYMCSAAYWLGSACDAIVAEKSAEVGSIGVLIQVPNPSPDAVAAGIVPVVISNREAVLKRIGYEPMSDEQEAYLMERAQSKFEAFRLFVEVNRPLPDGYRGETFDGGEAVLLGLVDIAGDYGVAEQLAREFADFRAASRG